MYVNLARSAASSADALSDGVAPFSDVRYLPVQLGNPRCSHTLTPRNDDGRITGDFHLEFLPSFVIGLSRYPPTPLQLPKRAAASRTAQAGVESVCRLGPPRPSTVQADVGSSGHTEALQLSSLPSGRPDRTHFPAKSVHSAPPPSRKHPATERAAAAHEPKPDNPARNSRFIKCGRLGILHPIRPHRLPLFQPLSGDHWIQVEHKGNVSGNVSPTANRLIDATATGSSLRATP